MQEISLAVFVLCIFLIGFVLGFFCLILLAGFENWMDRKIKKKAKKKEQDMRNDAFDKIRKVTQPEEVDGK